MTEVALVPPGAAGEPVEDLEDEDHDEPDTDTEEGAVYEDEDVIGSLSQLFPSFLLPKDRRSNVCSMQS